MPRVAKTIRNSRAAGVAPRVLVVVVQEEACHHPWEVVCYHLRCHLPCHHHSHLHSHPQNVGVVVGDDHAAHADHSVVPCHVLPSCQSRRSRKREVW